MKKFGLQNNTKTLQDLSKGNPNRSNMRSSYVRNGYGENHYRPHRRNGVNVNSWSREDLECDFKNVEAPFDGFPTNRTIKRSYQQPGTARQIQTISYEQPRPPPRETQTTIPQVQPKPATSSPQKPAYKIEPGASLRSGKDQSSSRRDSLPQHYGSANLDARVVHKKSYTSSCAPLSAVHQPKKPKVVVDSSLFNTNTSQLKNHRMDSMPVSNDRARSSSRLKKAQEQQQPDVVDLCVSDEDETYACSSSSSSAMNMTSKKRELLAGPLPGYFFAKAIYFENREFYPLERNCVVSIDAKEGLSFTTLSDPVTIEIGDEPVQNSQRERQHIPKVTIPSINEVVYGKIYDDNDICCIIITLDDSAKRSKMMSRMRENFDAIPHNTLEALSDDLDDAYTIYLITDEVNTDILTRQFEEYNRNVGLNSPRFRCVSPVTQSQRAEVQALLSRSVNDVTTQIMFDSPHHSKVARYGRCRSSKKEIGDDPEDAMVILMYPMEEGAQDVIALTQGDVKRLEDVTEYLNDNLIDFRMKRLMEQLKIEDIENYSRIHVFSSLFYTKLTEDSRENEGYELVKRWTKNVDIFEKEFLVIPINFANHWSLVVIVRPSICMEEYDSLSRSSSNGTEEKAGGEESDNKSCILFMDSLGMHSPSQIGKKLRSYLAREWADKKKPQENMDVHKIKSLALNNAKCNPSVNCHVHVS